MMKKIETKWRKLLRTIFGGISLTAVAFVFHACYGMPMDDSDLYYDVQFSGIVKSQTNGSPIKGIKVVVNEEKNKGELTDADGKFYFFASVPYYKKGAITKIESVKVHFLDIDALENGYFVDKTVAVEIGNDYKAVINVELTEKK